MTLALTEGYIGKTENLIKIETLFNEIISEISTPSNSYERIDKVFKLNLSWDKRINRIEKLFENEFGFKKFDLIFINELTENAFTLVNSKFSKVNIYDFNLEPTKHGNCYYDKSGKYCCSIWLYSLILTKFTGAEIVSILLHEIGHNFDVVDNIWVADIISSKILWETNYKTYDEDLDFHKWFMSRQAELTNYNSSKLKPADIKKWLDDTSSRVIYKLKKLPKKISKGIYHAITNFNNRDFWSNTASEFYADSFATAYGYGPDLMNSLRKFEDFNDSIGKSGSFIGDLSYLTFICPHLLLFMADPHPVTQTRLRRQIVDLEKIVNEPSTPSMTKKLAKRDLDLAKRVYTKYIKGNNSYVRSLIRVVNDYLFPQGSLDFRTYLIKITALSTEDDLKKRLKK